MENNKIEFTFEEDMIIARRNPSEKDSTKYIYWLNWVTNEFFKYVDLDGGKWESLTKKFIENHHADI